MPYAGKQIMARDFARQMRVFWRNYELTKGTATGIAESHLFLGAYHDNLDAEGAVVSRDCGVLEFNIPAADIGTPVEFQYRTVATDPESYMPVLIHSVETANEYYLSPWQRDGHKDIRRWQAWAAYTSGWATFPHSWVWHHDVDGNPIGPWVKTGRYIYQAIAGQMNNMSINEKLWTPEQALVYAVKYAAHFGITDASPILTTDKNGNRIVSWNYPAAPSSPPADGSGPYPVPNDGI